MTIIVRSMYNFVNCLQFNIRYEKVERPAPMGGALVFNSTISLLMIILENNISLKIFLTYCDKERIIKRERERGGGVPLAGFTYHIFVPVSN